MEEIKVRIFEPVVDDSLCRPDKPVINFHAGDGGTGVQKPDCQRAKTRAHLQDMVSARHSRDLDDFSNRVRVKQKVLPPGL